MIIVIEVDTTKGSQQNVTAQHIAEVPKVNVICECCAANKRSDEGERRRGAVAGGGCAGGGAGHQGRRGRLALLRTGLGREDGLGEANVSAHLR